MTNILAKKGHNGALSNALPPVAPPVRRSLNRELRHKTLVRIMDENTKLLVRLRDKPANYSAKQWAREDHSNFQLVRKISEYPNAIRTKAAYKSVDRSVRNLNNSQISSQSFNKPDRQVYSGSHDLGSQQTYRIEITVTKEQAIVIVAVNTATNEKDVIEIQPSMVKDVLQIFKNDFVRIAECLKAQDGKVVLLNPLLMEPNQTS
jgi:hypothetical protein